MIRPAIFLALFAASFAVFASCEKLDAVFENERASKVLSILAKESGLTLVNPELATTTINATFQGEDASKLLRVIAWDLGFELRIQGRKVWLQESGSLANDSGEAARHEI